MRVRGLCVERIFFCALPSLLVLRLSIAIAQLGLTEPSSRLRAEKRVPLFHELVSPAMAATKQEPPLGLPRGGFSYVQALQCVACAAIVPREFIALKVPEGR